MCLSTSAVPKKILDFGLSFLRLTNYTKAHNLCDLIKSNVLKINRSLLLRIFKQYQISNLI